MYIHSDITTHVNEEMTGMAITVDT